MYSSVVSKSNGFKYSDNNNDKYVSRGMLSSSGKKKILSYRTK